MSKLRDQVAVVTGATRGFGYALAQELLKTGASVVICGREQGNVDKTVENLSPIGKVKGIACDVSVPEQVYSLGRFAAKEKGTIDIWINNAGHAPLPGSIIDFSPKEALNTFRTNCMGVYNGTQTAFYYMLPRKKGTLVNIYGRGSRLEASSPTGLYASSKAWVTEFTRTLAQDYKGSGVQIVAFSPGMMLTDLVTVHQMVGERVSESMKIMPSVQKALCSPPRIPAAELVRLLATNQKEFVEYHWMRGLRAMTMILKLVWMQINPKVRPATVEYSQLNAFIPPIDQ